MSCASRRVCKWLRVVCCAVLLQSMKQSPFFGPFEREAKEWENLLNHGQEIFDVFVDVQRQWVYLEGIFLGSSDVQQQLAAQYRKFTMFDKEFVKLMREMKVRICKVLRGVNLP